MPGNALIGHTGFVGSTFARSDWRFSARFNSRTIEDIRGQSYDLVVCAGVSAVKWLANKEPEADWASIDRLMRLLSTVRAARFVLISTIDVYPNPVAVDESHPLQSGTGQPYGRHRLLLEEFVQRTFAKSHIIRLPGLFGAGLKKNIIFDLVNDNMVENISPHGHFQWYPLARIADDTRTIIDAGLPLMNVAPEPIGTASLAEEFFPERKIGPDSLPAVSYDMRTLHASVLGGAGSYSLSERDVRSDLGRYVAQAKRDLAAS